MIQASSRLRGFLEDHQIAYSVLAHRRDFTAQETADHTHTSGHCFAKSVVVCADGDFLMAVVPAHHNLDLAELARELRVRTIRLATEDELFELFPDCEVGSEPPFGNLYDLPVYMNPALRASEEITFNAGSHEEAIRMKVEDFEKLVHPRELEVSH